MQNNNNNENYFKSSLENFQKSLPFRKNVYSTYFILLVEYVKYLDKNSIVLVCYYRYRYTDIGMVYSYIT